jgi:hypothetical protein
VVGRVATALILDAQRNMLEGAARSRYELVVPKDESDAFNANPKLATTLCDQGSTAL